MASNKRTIHLGLDYSQFTGGVSEVNRKMGLLDAEFKLAQEQAKNYGNETDKLGLKQEYLTQKIALQNQKVEEAKRAYDQAMSSQNASQKEIDALDKKLLQERTTLEKLNGELKGADENIKKADKDTKTFGDQIRGMASMLGMNVSPAVEKLAKKFDGVSASLGNAVLIIGAVVTALGKWAIQNGETADSLLTLSDQTGLTTQDIQKLQYASEFVDVSVETMTGSLQKLTKTMSSARDGSKDAAEAFKQLHIKVTDSHGALRDSNEVFYETIDKLGKIKNETERDALAMKVFGKSAQELNPLIKAGSESLKELGIEAEALGKVWTDEEIAKSAKLNDAMEKFSKTTESLKEGLGMVLIPLLTDLFTAIGSIPPEILKTILVIATVVATIVLVVKAIKSLTGTAKAVMGFFQNFDISAAKTTLTIIAVVVALVALATIIAVIIGKSKDLQEAMGSVGKTAESFTSDISTAQNNVRKTQNHADGVINYAGGKTWVGEAGPELVTLPQGSNIIPEKDVGQTVINNYYATIDAKSVKEFNDIVRIMNEQRMAERRMAY